MLYASFARPVGMFDNFFNKAVAWMTGGEFCHSEFILTYPEAEFLEALNKIEGHDRLKRTYQNYVEDGHINICFYILWGNNVSYRLLKHIHNNPFYRMPNENHFEKVQIHINTNQKNKILEFLFNECGKNYDYQGALLYYIPRRNNESYYSKYFCSQLMVSALHQIQMYRDHNPSGITPNCLYKILTA